MGTVADNLRYTLNAVNDIQAAIKEKKISITDTTPLKSYGDKIREIRTLDFNKFRPWIVINHVYSYSIDNIKFCSFEETTVNVVSNTYN